MSEGKQHTLIKRITLRDPISVVNDVGFTFLLLLYGLLYDAKRINDTNI